MQPQRRTGRKTNRKNQQALAYPPSFIASKHVDLLQRFRSTAVLTAKPILVADLLDMLCVATGSTAAYGLATAFKLLKLHIWGNPSGAAGSSTFIQVEDAVTNSEFGGPSRRVSDESLGTSRPSHIKWKPRPDSILSKWISVYSQNQLLLVTCPMGAVIDLHVSLTIQDGDLTPQAVGGAVSGATTGKVYCRALDSNNASQLVPEAFPTI